MTATVTLLETRRFTDRRGWFAETYSAPRLADQGIYDRFVQDNHSYSESEGTIRGLHLQIRPRAQAKIVRCIRGAILDVAVDLRRGSPTFGRWVTASLTASNGRQLYVPVGFAHGFLTLEDHTEVVYKVSDTYMPELEMGVRWNDPDLAIDWPLRQLTPILSDGDAALPRLSEIESPFVYDGIPMTAMGCLD
jgi:dTDP-4-dehydrorhamnose 3,5-epimerase